MSSMSSAASPIPNPDPNPNPNPTSTADVTSVTTTTPNAPAPAGAAASFQASSSEASPMGSSSAASTFTSTSTSTSTSAAPPLALALAPKQRALEKQPKPNQQKPHKPSQSTSASATISEEKQTQTQTPTLTYPYDFRMIDIGANLLDDMYQGSYHGRVRHDPDLCHVISRAHSWGLSHIIITAGSLAESYSALEYVRDKEHLYTTVGVHPTRANELLQDTDAYVASMLQQAESGKKCGKIVAIGECGLDYERLQFASVECQVRAFEAHFALAQQTGLPMFLHNRNTKGAFIHILKQNRHKFKHGVVHSYDGPADELKELLKLDLYIGINGCSLKTPENIATMCLIPLNRLMIETDAPWCDIRATHSSYAHVRTHFPSVKPEKHTPTPSPTPTPAPAPTPSQTPHHHCHVMTTLVKGRNEPCTLIQVVEVIASARQLDISVVAKQVYHNTIAVFFPDSQSTPDTRHPTARALANKQEAIAGQGRQWDMGSDRIGSDRDAATTNNQPQSEPEPEPEPGPE